MFNQSTLGISCLKLSSIVSAINAKTLEVKFSKAVDSEKAKFEVKKAGITANVSKVTFAEDKKSATLELSTKITKGEYTVNVTGLTETALTKTIQAEDEKVESIQILSDAAVVDNTSTPTSAKVGYQVKNQYGEDITKTTALTTNGGNITASNGVATITLASGAKVGDKLAVTLINVDSAKSATQVVTLSAAAAVTEVAIDGIYNKDGKSLNEDSNLTSDNFYVLVNLKDQYGNDLTDTSAASGLIKAQSNTTVVGTEGAGSAVTLTSLTIDGKKRLGLKLTGTPKAGENQVTLISTTSGKSAAYKINVAETTRTDAVTLSAPSIAVVGEDVLLPASVLDKEGKAITDTKVLNDANKGVKVSYNGSALSNAFVTVDNVLYVKVPAASVTAEGVFPIVAQSSTYKVATSTINVKKAAEATVIRGLKSSVSATIKAGDQKVIDASSLVIEDQYGRVMDSAKVKTALTGGKKIVVKDVDTTSNVVTFSGDITSGTTATLRAGSKNGTEKLQFVLHDGTKEVVSSTAEATFRVTDGTEYKSFTVDPIGTVYDEVGNNGKTDNNAYDKAVVVYGVLADGSKVELGSGDYAVSSTNTQLNADVSSDRVIDASSAFTYASGTSETKLPLTVTINATGEKFKQEVTISKVAPKVTKLDAVAQGKAVDVLEGKTVAPLDKFDYVDAAVFNKAKLDAKADFVVTDQYGVAVDLDTAQFPDGTTFAAPTLTFTKVTGNLVFSGNGTATASVTELPLNSVFNTVVSVGSVDSAPIKVTATPGYSAGGADTAAQADVDAKAAAVASTFAASGAVGATAVPTIAGHTVAVKSSSDTAKYAADGKIVAAGTSNVVYTLTNTTTGKKADTAPVAVTVTVTP